MGRWATENGGDAFWKPHALAKPHEGQLDLRMGDRVRTTVDLPGVPAGARAR